MYTVFTSHLFEFAFAQGKRFNGRAKKSIRGKYDIVVAEGKDSYLNTIKAIEAMGGMRNFVKKDAIVVVKPNIAWDRTPEQAANTDPGVAAALVELCYKAGAKRVNVFDIPCNEAKRVYESSGIRKAAMGKGAPVPFLHHDDFGGGKAVEVGDGACG